MKIQDIIEQNKKSIILVDVQIPAEGNQKKISIKGTGFIISPDGKFITNAHVYKAITEEEMDYAGVSVPGKTDEKGSTFYDRYKIALIGQIDEENDMALMQIISDKKDFQTVGNLETTENIKEGEDVAFIGYPLAVELLNMGFGITMTTNKCIISSIKRRGADGSLHFFLVDTHINGGSSGSPVFSAETGNIVGISSARISSKIPIPGGVVADIPANMGICRPIKYAIELINKNK
ncbi:MAG: hypothetical protein A3C50_01295 [Candidatus Staskawiczbacteria bacterium RIFCSPHIGHO2_02_FULL_43_16]|uniref:Serine protease n=1 Tax=Candidatus Staskawiczbacteria bacterium RIFCSPHIGHO2_01_FULL_41_41 TaxID=1802203 RepID=A0A1G2HUU0_9BACT|nr:MAG: hypothetical protein A2822_04620 [Candidatus Staskawiczbacteria bacterium RIFCSPHIGHO2_01_FULL_41_41]OGZ68843.1 MAG: hypothetical protein A3C50_01295 [Candidatus Staskawiczbacteria bacterium RIFCSPHIGHO2_02_FULL_43_16]OGZ74216.1 MAG: hypothetical protein A3A12_00285 [Candidatus Staskawiczbacteria bacterium RIFCSPLOWO2_01_FULL_43_17b]